MKKKNTLFSDSAILTADHNSAVVSISKLCRVELAPNSSLRVCFVDHSLTAMLLFFPAEDGIRDLYVTGVQTCALPIWGGCSQLARRHSAMAPRRPGTSTRDRSEERRGGKECRSRWAPYHEKKKERKMEVWQSVDISCRCLSPTALKL